jgi:hypothetical protein
MENIYQYLVIGQMVAIILLAIWIKVLVDRAKRELVYTKEELNLTIKSLESELTKLKKDVLKHSYQHEKQDKNGVNQNA